MNKEKLAAKLLDGREYLKEITEEIGDICRENPKIVVVFGDSDDQIKFRGAINAEVDCYEGEEFALDRWGLVENECDEPECPYHAEKRKAAPWHIRAVWWDDHSDGYSWTYESNIPHETFDIWDGEDKYCRGMVFSIEDLG